jgi:hypothetical protein
MSEFPFTRKLPLIEVLVAKLSQDTVDERPLDAETLCSLLNVTFWASMASEEGRPVRASLALTDRPISRSQHTIRFSEAIELSANSIAKLSAGFPFQRGAIGIAFSSQGRPMIWGIMVPKPEYEWSIEILGPGYLAVRGKYFVQAAILPNGSVAHFRDDRMRPDDQFAHLLFNEVAHSCLGESIPFEERHNFYGLLQVLSRSMTEHRRGGSIVWVDPAEGSWRDAVDFTYQFAADKQLIAGEERFFYDGQPYLKHLHSKYHASRDRWVRNEMRKRKVDSEDMYEPLFPPESQAERNLHQALRLVGGLTGVDGALVMTNRWEIIGFGAKLMAKATTVPIREWSPFQNYAKDTNQLGSIGGTRHRSAAQFAFEHPGTVIFVASQDGRFTIFSADSSGTEVLAFRIELLLL